MGDPEWLERHRRRCTISILGLYHIYQNGLAEIIVGLGSYRWYHCTSMNYGITSSIPLASWHGAEIDLQVQEAAVALVLRRKVNVEWDTRKAGMPKYINRYFPFLIRHEEEH